MPARSSRRAKYVDPWTVNPYGSDQGSFLIRMYKLMCELPKAWLAYLVSDPPGGGGVLLHSSSCPLFHMYCCYSPRAGSSPDGSMYTVVAIDSWQPPLCLSRQLRREGGLFWRELTKLEAHPGANGEAGCGAGLAWDFRNDK